MECHQRLRYPVRSALTLKSKTHEPDERQQAGGDRGKRTRRVARNSHSDHERVSRRKGTNLLLADPHASTTRFLHSICRSSANTACSLNSTIPKLGCFACVSKRKSTWSLYGCAGCHYWALVSGRVSMVTSWNLPRSRRCSRPFHVWLDLSRWVHAGRYHLDQGPRDAGPATYTELLGAFEVRTSGSRIPFERVACPCVILWFRQRLPIRLGRFRAWVIRRDNPRGDSLWDHSDSNRWVGEDDEPTVLPFECRAVDVVEYRHTNRLHLCGLADSAILVSIYLPGRSNNGRISEEQPSGCTQGSRQMC